MKLGAVDRVVPLDRIAAAIMALVRAPRLAPRAAEARGES